MAVSANTLFHFTGCLDNLVNILNSGGFWPRYCVEYGWRKKFAVCQCCFCDIPLSDIQKHTKNYGCYGLGMSKEWGMSNGISPVMYLIKDSFMGKNIVSMAKNVPKEGDRKLLAMLKVYKGVNYKKDKSGRQIRQNNYPYYDEREWRYVPPTIAPENMCVLTVGDKDLSVLNDGMKGKLLNFTVADIKYIIVPSKQRELLLAQIKNMVNYPDKDKEILMSKILTTELIFSDI